MAEPDIPTVVLGQVATPDWANLVAADINSIDNRTTDLEGDLATEIAARAAADTTLGNSITAVRPSMRLRGTNYTDKLHVVTASVAVDTIGAGETPVDMPPGDTQGVSDQIFYGSTFSGTPVVLAQCTQKLAYALTIYSVTDTYFRVSARSLSTGALVGYSTGLLVTYVAIGRRP